MSDIRRLVVDTRVQAFVIILVKILRDATLRIGQVGKNGPLTQFEPLRFETGPQTFGLCIIIAIAATALRAHGLVVVE